MGLLDFNPNDPAAIQHELRERQDELSDRAATAIQDLLNQVRTLQDQRTDIRRQVEPWGMLLHRMVEILGRYLQRHRIDVTPAYRDALMHLCERAVAVRDEALAQPDTLLPPIPKPLQKASGILRVNWAPKGARKKAP